MGVYYKINICDKKDTLNVFIFLSVAYFLFNFSLFTFIYSMYFIHLFISLSFPPVHVIPCFHFYLFPYFFTHTSMRGCTLKVSLSSHWLISTRVHRSILTAKHIPLLSEHRFPQTTRCSSHPSCFISSRSLILT